MKFLIVLIIGLGVIFGVPSLRARVMPKIEPVLTKLGIGDRLANPIKRRTAENELRVVVQKLEEGILEKRKKLPTEKTFPQWVYVNTRLSKRGVDPWGSKYYLSRVGQQMTVGSNGPDLTRDTPDDVRLPVAAR